MRRLIVAGLFVWGCAGTDPPGADNSAAQSNQAPNATPNSATNNTGTNGTSNAMPNNGTANNGSTNSGTTSTTNNTTANSNPNNAAPEWRALVANADLTGDTSTWNVIVFDGTSASVTFPQAFGSGNLAVAASGDRGYVVDLDSGMVVVIDSERGTEIETIDLGITDLDSAAADAGTLVAASGSNSGVAQYSSAGGGLGLSIPLPGASAGATQFARSVSIIGSTVAGVLIESAMFPTSPQLFVADTTTATLVDVDPTMAGPMTLGLNGATRLDRIGPDLFAVGTELEGILILRKDGATWVTDQTLMPRGAFNNAEVENVVMGTPTAGIAFTYGTSFAAYRFDSSAGTATTIDGLALPTGLIGGDASAGGAYYFVGDYGVRNVANMPWGVGIVDADGTLLDHVQTDDALPPSSIAALN